MKNLFIVLIISAIATNSFAQVPDTSLCQTGYRVYFGNGVKAPDAIHKYDAAYRVKDMLGPTYGDQREPVEYWISYNPTDGMLGDLLEAFAQKRAEDPTLSWQLFFRWVSGEFISTSLLVALEDYFGTTGAQKIAQAAAKLSSPQAYTDPVVIGHSSSYESALLEGKRVMVVAHSQGNLYANAAYGRLRNINSSEYDLGAFGIAAVASPANFVATADKGDSWVTSDTDHVIDAVRIVAPATLSGNDNSVPFFDIRRLFRSWFLRDIHKSSIWNSKQDSRSDDINFS